MCSSISRTVPLMEIVPPYTETIDYTHKVLAFFRIGDVMAVIESLENWSSQGETESFGAKVTGNQHSGNQQNSVQAKTLSLVKPRLIFGLDTEEETIVKFRIAPGIVN